jgi:hypothetical protein
MTTATAPAGRFARREPVVHARRLFSMKKTVWTYGLLSGAISAVTMLVGLLFMNSGNLGKSEIFGWTSIVLAALLVFFGVRSYRENVSAGRLTFGRGLAVGALIALISSCCYVATWEIIYFSVPGFGEKLVTCMVDRVKDSGASQEKIDAMVKQTEMFKKLWANPVTNAAVTFIEPLPVGLAFALVSAALLRKK